MSAVSFRRSTRRVTRFAAPAALGLATALLAAGCGASSTPSSSSTPGSSSGSSSGSTSDPGKTVDVVLWESHKATSPAGKAEQAIVNMFNASQHGVHVKLLITSGSTNGLAAAQAGHPPILAEVSHYDGAFRNGGLIVDQTPLMDGAGGFTRGRLASFYPGVLENGRIPQAIGANGQPVPGKQYRFPNGTKVEELFYDTAMFKQAGIASCPATWSALGRDLVKLKALGVTPMGFKDASAHIESVFVADGGSLYKPGSHLKQTMYDSKAGIAEFTMFRQWYQQKLFVFSHGANMRAAIANKKLAIEDGTSAGWVKVRDEAKAAGVQVSACPYPNGISGHEGNIIQGLGFVIFTHHTAAQQKAAFEFVKFWNTPKVQAYWAQASGFAPNVKSAVADIPASYLDSNAGAGLEVSIGILDSPYARPRGQSDAYAEVDQAVDAAFFDAATTTKPIGQILAKLDRTDAGYLKGSTKI